MLLEGADPYSVADLFEYRSAFCLLIGFYVISMVLSGTF